MKCDELKPLVFSLNELSFIDESAVQKDFENPHDHAVYKATEVDAAIVELKQELQNQCISCPVKMQEDDVVADKDKQIAELKAALEDEKASRYAESVDAGMRERRLKRALWLERAERAKECHFMWCQLIYDKKYGIVKFNIKKEWGENVKQGQMLHTPQGWADVWDEVERKCRAMAEEY